MTSDKRMFNRKIFHSSVCVKLAECNEGKELHAQRLWEALILDADDHGRGKFIPISLRAAAFGTTPTAYTEVTNDDIEKWMREIEETGAIVIYDNNVGERFYALTGWKVYQSGNWRRKPSLIPDPPHDKQHLFKTNPHDPTQEPDRTYTEAIHETPETYTGVTGNRIEENRREEKKNKIPLKSNSKPNPPPEYTQLVKELFPDIDQHRATQQAEIIDQIIRIDKFPFDKLKPILQWAREDDFWSTNFLSCAPLRKRRNGAGDAMKWQKIKASYDKDNESRYV